METKHEKKDHAKHFHHEVMVVAAESRGYNRVQGFGLSAIPLGPILAN